MGHCRVVVVPTVLVAESAAGLMEYQRVVQEEPGNLALAITMNPRSGIFDSCRQGDNKSAQSR